MVTKRQTEASLRRACSTTLAMFAMRACQFANKVPRNVTVISEQGNESVAVLGPDEFRGEGCLAGQPPRMGTATAMTECEIMRLERAAMIRVIHDEPAFFETTQKMFTVYSA
jgi:hypothetical protein